MIVETLLSEGIPKELRDAFGSRAFALAVNDQVFNDCFGIKNALDNPAAYCVEKPRKLVQVRDESFAVVVKLTGVSRAKREDELFGDVLRMLSRVTTDVISKELGLASLNARVQVFAILVVDDEVQNPDTKERSPILEHGPVWVTKDGPEWPDEDA